VEVQRGTTLRTALLLNGLSPHNGRAQLINCRGLGTCGTCAVEVRWVCEGCPGATSVFTIVYMYCWAS